MRFFILSFFLTAYVSCKPESKKLDADKWYEQTKEFILKESNQPIDSTSIEHNETGHLVKQRYFHNGQLVFEKWFQENGEQRVQINYSKDQQFEIRQENYPSGQILFEGIFYQNHSYGLSTWWDNGKLIEEKGIRFKDRKIGVWKRFYKYGDSTLTDYGNTNLIDSLGVIKHFDN